MADYGQVLLMRRQEVQEDYEGQGREVQGLEEGVSRGITAHEDVVQGGRQSACGDCPLTSQGQGCDLSSPTSIANRFEAKRMPLCRQLICDGGGDFFFGFLSDLVTRP